MLQAASLSKLARIRHGFFTRSGGVSQGVYASLNGGVGSNDAPDKVAENRARMATALGVAPEHLLTAYQIHSPDVVVADRPWPPENRPRADAIVSRTPAARDRRIHRRLRTAVVRRCRGRRRRRGTCRLARCAHWRDRGGGRRHGRTRRQTRADGGGARPHHRQPNYEVGPEFVARFLAADADTTRFFASAWPRNGHAMFDLGGYIHNRLTRAGVLMIEDLDLCTYADEARLF